MAKKQEYEFTLILSDVQELTRKVLDAFYEAGCDDALIGMRDGVAYAEFCREADSFREAVLSAIRDVESAGVDAKVEHIEPDEFVTMSEIARRLNITREGVRKTGVGGARSREVSTSYRQLDKAITPVALDRCRSVASNEVTAIRQTIPRLPRSFAMKRTLRPLACRSPS